MRCQTVTPDAEAHSLPCQGPQAHQRRLRKSPHHIPSKMLYNYEDIMAAGPIALEGATLPDTEWSVHLCYQGTLAKMPAW